MGRAIDESIDPMDTDLHPAREVSPPSTRRTHRSTVVPALALAAAVAIACWLPALTLGVAPRAANIATAGAALVLLAAALVARAAAQLTPRAKDWARHPPLLAVAGWSLALAHAGITLLLLDHEGATRATCLASPFAVGCGAAALLWSIAWGAASFGARNQARIALTRSMPPAIAAAGIHGWLLGAESDPSSLRPTVLAGVVVLALLLWGASTARRLRARLRRATLWQHARDRAGFTAVLATWVITVGSGMWILVSHANRAGIPAAAPRSWPADAGIARADGLATMLLFAHPRCPCTRATLGELDRIMTHAQGMVRAYVLFVVPPGVAPGWERTDLWDSARATPGVEVIADHDGTLALRFGSITSGQVLLYDAAGSLAFAGGITPARGHAGDNDGESALLSLLRLEPTEATRTPVFGCPLQGEYCPAGEERDAAAH
jgi:hypothetical protein